MENKQRFTVFLLAEEDGGFSAHFPHYPGVFTWGDTAEEALERAKGGIEAYLEALAEDDQDLMLDLAHIPYVMVGEVVAVLSPAVQAQAEEEAEYSSEGQPNHAGGKSHFVSTTEAGEELGITSSRMRRLLLDGRVKGAKKIGRNWVIPTPIMISRGSRGREGVAGRR